MITFPYTNFHRLNLDTMIAEINKLKGMIEREDSPGYNVLNYGLAADGVTDNSDALDDMLDDLGENISIYFPPGNYVFTRPIHATNVSIYGAGKQVTFLHFIGGINGLILEQNFYPGTNNSYCVTIENLSIMQTDRGGRAIYISGNASSDRATQAPVIRNIKIDSTNGNKFRCGWQNGIKIEDCNGAVIDMCSITGGVNGSEPSYYSITAIELTSTHNPLATDYKVINSMMYYWQYACNADWFEGLNFINNTIVGCYHGLKVGPYAESKYHPLVIVDNCHINAAYMCIRAESIKEIIVANSSFYNQLEGDPANNYGIFAIDCNTIQIHDCQLLNLSTKNHFAIQLSNCDVANIHHNISKNKSTGTEIYAINLDGCSNCLVLYNMTEGAIRDLAGTNTLVGNVRI